MSEIFATAAAVLAYGVGTALTIELPNGRRVTPVAAFGPALVALGGSGYDVAPTWFLLSAGILCEAGVRVATKGSLRTAVVNKVGLIVSFGLLAGADGLGLGLTPALLAVVALGCLAYFAADAAMHPSFKDALRTSGPLYVVMASAAGVLVLVYPSLGWVSYLVMFVPVLAARHEFERYARAWRTYDQTVRALAGLVEGAGYVPMGHQERVAALCVSMGQELGLPAGKLRELELVALLHDVGAVSLPDPAQAAAADAAAIANMGGRVLEETEFLADHASTLIEAARGGVDLSLPAAILAIANAYDSVEGDTSERLSALKALPDVQGPLLAALARVVSGSK